MANSALRKSSWVGSQDAATFMRPMVLSWIGVLLFASAGCVAASPSSSASSACPKLDYAYINTGCVMSQPPELKTTGPCTASAVGQHGQDVELTAKAAGTCHVERTVGSATSSTDVTFALRPIPLGSDPSGCGQGFVAVTEDGGSCIGCQFPVPEWQCDAGTGASD